MTFGDLNTYELDLPTSMKIHNAFHSSLLQAADQLAPLDGQTTPPPPPIEINNDEGEHQEWELDEILDSKLVKARGRAMRDGTRRVWREYLVSWKGYNEQTWEREDALANAPMALAAYQKRYPLSSIQGATELAGLMVQPLAAQGRSYTRSNTTHTVRLPVNQQPAANHQGPDEQSPTALLSPTLTEPSVPPTVALSGMAAAWRTRKEDKMAMPWRIETTVNEDVDGMMKEGGNVTIQASPHASHVTSRACDWRGPAPSAKPAEPHADPHKRTSSLRT